jgi:hypothetical protein
MGPRGTHRLCLYFVTCIARSPSRLVAVREPLQESICPLLLVLPPLVCELRLTGGEADPTVGCPAAMSEATDGPGAAPPSRPSTATAQQCANLTPASAQQPQQPQGGASLRALHSQQRQQNYPTDPVGTSHNGAAVCDATVGAPTRCRRVRRPSGAAGRAATEWRCGRMRRPNGAGRRAAA